MPVKAERRLAERKSVDSIQISELTSLTNYVVLAHRGEIVDASITGFLLRVDRKELIPKELKGNLNMDSMIGQQVVMYLPQMNLDLDGRVIRTEHLGRGIFEIAIDFSEEVPDYWRECLIELLPGPGEMDLSKS